MTSRGAGTHRNDLSTHAHRLMAGVAEEVTIDGNGLPVVLISPASIITERRKTQPCLAYTTWQRDALDCTDNHPGIWLIPRRKRMTTKTWGPTLYNKLQSLRQI